MSYFNTYPPTSALQGLIRELQIYHLKWQDEPGFEHVLKLKREKVDKSWIATAVDCGYTDAPHLFREFKEFANFPPALFYLQPTSGYSYLSTG